MNWKDIILIASLLILAIAPGVIYCYLGVIELDKAKFAEQWSKTIITSLILIYAVKYLDHRASNTIKNKLRNEVIKFISVNRLAIKDNNDIDETFNILKSIFPILDSKGIISPNISKLKEIAKNSHLIGEKEFTTIKAQITSTLKNLENEIQKQS